jgi:hypothetical protein
MLSSDVSSIPGADNAYNKSILQRGQWPPGVGAQPSLPSQQCAAVDLIASTQDTAGLRHNFPDRDFGSSLSSNSELAGSPGASSHPLSSSHWRPLKIAVVIQGNTLHSVSGMAA